MALSWLVLLVLICLQTGFFGSLAGFVFIFVFAFYARVKLPLSCNDQILREESSTEESFTFASGLESCQWSLQGKVWQQIHVPGLFISLWSRKQKEQAGL